MTPTRLSADARREQIIEVSIDVFGRAGYFGASMNDIAEAAGVTKPVLYQHFDSKGDLYSALLDTVGNRMLQAIATATDKAPSGKEQTRRGFQAYFRWVAQSHDEFMLLFGSSARHNGEFIAQLRQITDHAAATITPLIAIDVDDEQRRTLAHAIVGLAEGASRRLVDIGAEFDPDEIAEAVSTLAWAGLRAAGRSDA